MDKKKRIVFILRLIMIPIGIISIVFLPPWNGVFAWLAPLPGTVQEQVSEAIKYDLDGIIVYVDKGGQPAELYAAGMKDRGKEIPADPESLFKIASISKLYDAVLVTKLVNDQRLSLDDTLADRLPELAGRIENAEVITLGMMVQHRSGIPNYSDQAGFMWDAPPQTVAGTLDLIEGLPADFAPGETYAYSNTNYLLINEIIEKELGYGKFEYMTEKILIPLGLTNTFGSLEDVDPDDVMSGYYVGLETDFKPIDFGMLATVEDVGIFIRALNDGSLLNDRERAIYDSIYEYGHKGWVLGYQSIAYYHADIDTVVIQFVNTVSDETELTTQVIYDRIVKILKENK